MERWVPLFQIFLHSPCPEGEASLWFHHQPQGNVTSAFLSLLQEPVTVLPGHRRRIWIQTLPPAVQSRILTFLSIESHRFCSLRLRSIVSHILEDESYGDRRDKEYFWVVFAARHLLDTLPRRDDLLDHFNSIPPWLSKIAEEETPLLPWLPLSPSRICDPCQSSSFPQEEEFEEEQEENLYPTEEENPDIKIPSPATSQKVSSVKNKLSAATSLSDFPVIVGEIQSLCFNLNESNHQESLQILNKLELWRIEDEAAAIFLSQTDDPCVSGLLLAAVVFPKLPSLRNRVSRVLLSATVEFCKLHKVAAVNALFLPLILLKEGLNTHHCDLLNKIIKDCLHPSQISACCHKLLTSSSPREEIVCLPSLHSMISEKPVWNESMFSLFHQIMVQGVQLTPDSVDNLVLVVEELVVAHAKSLKFCNFLLSMVGKCPRAVRCHKLSLIRVAERTETFLTKSIVSKLTSQ